ncbi:Uncharacterised protein [Mycobacterium tuberculosis]|nr:Uncharacterised protein [Mycobacterium tuberculosis]
MTWLYRKHPDQSPHPTKVETWAEYQDTFIRQRLNAIRTATPLPPMNPVGDSPP